MEELTMMDVHREIMAYLPEDYHLSVHFSNQGTFIRAGKLRAVRDYTIPATEDLARALMFRLRALLGEAQE